MNAAMQRSRLEKLAHTAYASSIRRLVQNELGQQRIKLAWFIWGYWPVLFIGTWPITDRIRLLCQFLRVDWCVPLAHRPSEVAAILKAISERGVARTSGVFVEAGCWAGGSTAKFSQICGRLGIQLLVYDSFEGVEPVSREELSRGGHDFSGEYASPETVLRNNLAKYGRTDLCTVVKGWFSQTLAKSPVAEPVRFVYIDCDTAKGTREVLAGVMPRLVADGVIFTQDYHIAVVRETLHDIKTWDPFDRGIPCIKHLTGNVAMIHFEDVRDPTASRQGHGGGGGEERNPASTYY